ncbi:multidrug resistance protein A [Alicyclobacillus cellulosilyticus]|uniref:Multidrug resistance protein A n=1 Tax=Alicyclobacillus cellulosilyticus TaxID=1003997 RepID=A0A917KIE8_9BACL|nr:efflux RND transporter periplasmic adaptor subunit [Alicyclobacillus cellulosilyticus]GGJ14139.1 multidrug resistance protein A [Alicyclobacillus cellulosilyticus]
MNARRLLVVNILIILVIIVVGFVGYYLYNQSTMYLSTDNAQVSGQQIAIDAPAAGKLVHWKGALGAHFNAGQAVGDIDVGGGKLVPVAMPQDGTIVLNSAVNNEFVAPGTPLAYAYDLNHLWVTANIKETEISDVKVGQDVDVTVDAYPGITLKGTVSQIGLATAATFSLLPQNNDTANFTKVTQVIPVIISLQGDQGIGLVPGMSATVRIHR